MSDKLYLCYDLKGIQSFIFAVPRVRYICGGSALIDRFDRETVPSIRIDGVQHIFSGGGKGAFYCNDAAAAQRLQHTLVAKAHADGLSICFGCNSDYTEAAHVTDSSYPFLPHPGELDGHPCQESGLYPVSHGQIHPIISKRVFQKGDRIDRWFERELSVNEHHVFFHDVAQNSSEGMFGCEALGARNRWAVIVMDGNNMGDQHRMALERLDRDHFITWLSRMSKDLHDCCRESCRQAIETVVNKWLKDDKSKSEVARAKMDDGTTILPIRPLLVGGDDMIILCHVRYAFDFVRTACARFEALSKEKAIAAQQEGIALWPATGGTITLTAGVLFAPVSLPLASALNYAELLLASAKNKGRKHPHGKPAPACIDWESVTEGIIDTPQARRQRELVFFDNDINERITLTRRPYEIAELGQLFELMRSYANVPATIRHQVLPGLRAGYWDRQVFVARLGKRDNPLVKDLEETKSSQGRWKPDNYLSSGEEKKGRVTDVIDALLLMEEDARMSWQTT